MLGSDDVTVQLQGSPRSLHCCCLKSKPADLDVPAPCCSDCKIRELLLWQGKENFSA